MKIMIFEAFQLSNRAFEPRGAALPLRRAAKKGGLAPPFKHCLQRESVRIYLNDASHCLSGVKLCFISRSHEALKAGRRVARRRACFDSNSIHKPTL